MHRHWQRPSMVDAISAWLDTVIPPAATVGDGRPEFPAERRELTWATWQRRSAQRERDALPRVVVVYDVMSITPMVLAEAASGLCRIVWVVDGGDPVMGPMVRLLRRLGEVVDRAGLDTDAVASAVASHQPSGILTFAEAQMPFTAAMAERLSLTYHSVLTADRLADKFLQRQALHDAGLPGPAVWEAPTPGAGEQEDARAIEELAGQVTYPVVVKPRRGTSSVATARADDERQLSELLTRFGAQEGGLLVEEYLADRVSGGTFADDIAVELLAQGGRVWHLATTGKFSVRAALPRPRMLPAEPRRRRRPRRSCSPPPRPVCGRSASRMASPMST